MSMKFGLLIDVDLRKKVTSSNTKQDVVLSRCGRHLEIIHDVITPPWMASFGRNLKPDSEYYAFANYCDLVKIAKRISIWRTFVFPNRK